MFTGIIESKASVISNVRRDGGNRLIIAPAFSELQTGESIAVNGVCLTLLAAAAPELSFDLSPETLKKTNLGSLSAGVEVNLERSMLASTRFGGHYVSGHVDTMAQVQIIQKLNEYIEVELAGFEAEAMRYLIPKGSISVEGVSLTINAVAKQSIKLILVPHTLSKTTLSSLTVGQRVNIEFDYLTRIVVYQLQLMQKF